MQALVEIAPGQPSVTLTVDELRSAIVAGRVHGLAKTSLDGGRTWAPAWRAANLPPPQQPAGDDAALRMIIPVGRSGWAIAAGYFAILTLLTDIGWLPTAMLAPHLGVADAAKVSGLCFLFVGIPPLALALLGHRAIRRDPQKHGMGRVGFAYVTVGLLVVGSLAAIVRALVS